MKKRTVVISGVNIVEGGAYSIYKDCLDAIIKNNFDKENNVVALVHEIKLFEEYLDSDIDFIPLPKAKKHWITRIYYEYFGFKKIFKGRDVDIWLSLHDITPNVDAKKQYVYCHNPSPFYKMKFKEIKYGWKNYLFSKFYKYLYQINIHKNTEVIVQQKWLKDEFEKMYGLNNVIVARPSIPEFKNTPLNVKKKGNTIKFLYPSYPRPFKNFELVCEAARILSAENPDFEVYITLSGNENNYSKMLKERYGNITNIKFVGLLSRDSLYKLYEESDCLVFTSKLETFGMPILEYKPFNKKMILANLPYAHDTLGDYNQVLFNDVNDVEQMVESMKKIILGSNLSANAVENLENNDFYYSNWDKLLMHIINY